MNFEARIAKLEEISGRGSSIILQHADGSFTSMDGHPVSRPEKTKVIITLDEDDEKL